MEKSLRYMRSRFLTFLLGAALSGILLFGCGEDEPVEVDGEILPLQVTKIILTPKSPSPGDTVQVTAVVVSDTINLEFPTISWSADGGIFLESDQLSVRWLAPLQPEIYSISVTAANSVSSSDLSIKVSVNSITEVLSDGAGELHVTTSGDSIYMLTSPDPPKDPDFEGLQVSLYIDGVGITPVTTGSPGFDYSFSKDLTYSAHTLETRLGGQTIENPIDVILDDLQTGVQQQITADDFPTGVRHNQHTEPTISPDNNLVAFQVFRPFPAAGQVDTFDVAVYDRSLARETNVTGTHGIFRKNFFPSFSTDGNWLLFVSNRTGQILWEVYGLPISGGTVETDSASTVRMTNSGGVISEGVLPSKPLYTWNPNPAFSVLAIGDATGQVHIIDPDGPSDFIVPVPDPPTEMVWSADGEQLAIATGLRLYLFDYTLGQPGNLDMVKEAEPGDIVSDIAWSRDNAYCVFRLLRAGGVWYELVDVEGRLGLTESVIITSAISSGFIGDYGTVMNTSPRWGSGGEIYILYFDFSSPRLMFIDLSGALP